MLSPNSTLDVRMDFSLPELSLDYSIFGLIEKNKGGGLKMPWTKLIQYSYKVFPLPKWISIL